jgi:serine/threonine protein kinase
MSRRPDACDPRQLDLFLRNRLPGDSQRDVETHLLVCPACRAKLDELAGGHRWWTDVRRYLGGDGATQMWPMDRAGPARGAGVELDFLKASTTPGSLGRLGTYEILEVLGQGGMGMVLKAFDPALHRPVAIKVLAAAYAANGTARKRFAREARATAAVIHDHVVPVHNVDADATPPYLVMAFIPGQSLQQRIDHSGPLELKEILRIGMQTASGLAAAHAQGLVHRDIKPANIMLENGVERVRITDFGLARAVDDASVTQGGAVAGTPQYMAPEQAQAQTVDQRADLFSLGSTLYAMCTGQAPFRGDFGMAVIRQVCDVEPPSIRSINPDIPEWLEGIVRKLHAKDPARRLQSAAEVAELLERCLAHVQQPDRHPLPEIAQDLGRRVPRPPAPRVPRRWWPAAAALTASVILGLALFLLLGHQRTQLTTEQGQDEPVGGMMVEPGEMLPWEDGLTDAAVRLRDQLDGFRQSLMAEGIGPVTGVESELDRARERVEILRRHLSDEAATGVDPVQSQLESIRQRLKRLQEAAGQTAE